MTAWEPGYPAFGRETKRGHRTTRTVHLLPEESLDRVRRRARGQIAAAAKHLRHQLAPAAAPVTAWSACAVGRLHGRLHGCWWLPRLPVEDDPRRGESGMCREHDLRRGRYATDAHVLDRDPGDGGLGQAAQKEQTRLVLLGEDDVPRDDVPTRFVKELISAGRSGAARGENIYELRSYLNTRIFFRQNTKPT